MGESNINTDTSIATDKVTTVTTDTSTASMKPVRSDDEKSLGEAEEMLSQNQETAFYPDLGGYTPPLRINTAKLGLASSFATLEIPRELRKETSRKMRRRKSDPASGKGSGSRS